MRFLIYLLSLMMLIGPTQTYADEIDRIKEKLVKNYDEIIPLYRDVTKNSFIAADKYIEGIFLAIEQEIETSLLETAPAIQGDLT